MKKWRFNTKAPRVRSESRDLGDIKLEMGEYGIFGVRCFSNNWKITGFCYLYKVKNILTPDIEWDRKRTLKEPEVLY